MESKKAELRETETRMMVTRTLGVGEMGLFFFFIYRKLFRWGIKIFRRLIDVLTQKVTERTEGRRIEFSYPDTIACYIIKLFIQPIHFSNAC